MTSEVTTILCECEGTGTEQFQRWVKEPVYEPTEAAGPVLYDSGTCPHCEGRGVTRKDGYRFRNDSAMKASMTRGTARTCRRCNEGHGWWARWLEAHRPCLGTGLPRGMTARAVLPTEELTAFVSRADMELWLGSIEIKVVRTERYNTWGEMNLGVGAFRSTWITTDYGRAWDTGDLENISKVTENLLRHRGQYSTYVSRETGVVADGLVIMVTRNGYAPVPTWEDAAPTTLEARAGLPPAYTDQLLDGPA